MMNELLRLHKYEELQSLIKNKKLLKEDRVSNIHNFFTAINSINQAINARQTFVEIGTYSAYTISFVELLRTLKLVYNYELKVAQKSEERSLSGKPVLERPTLVIYFKMQSEGVALLKYIQPISRPSYRKYLNYAQLRKVQKYSLYSFFPYLLLNNSEYGLITHLGALKYKVGGHVLAKLHLTKFNP